MNMLTSVQKAQNSSILWWTSQLSKRVPDDKRLRCSLLHGEDFIIDLKKCEKLFNYEQHLQSGGQTMISF